MTHDPAEPPPLPKGRARWIIPLVVGALLVGAVGFVVAVGVIPAEQDAPPPKTTPPVNVEVMPVRPLAELIDTISLPGTIEPNRTVLVAAEVEGRIERIPCREGRPCREGDRLVELNTDLLQADYDRTKAKMAFDAREVERVRELMARDVATSTEYDQARTQAAASKAAFQAAEARLERAVVTAPIAGVLNRVEVEVGEYVSPGNPVAQIVETDPVLAVVDVPEKDVPHLRVGQAERVTLDALDNRTVTGTISYIGELADPASRTTRVELTIPNPDGAIHSGQIITAHLERRRLRDAIVIPLRAVISLEEGYRVYVVEAGLAVPRHVTLGLLKGRSVVVDRGLAPGDRLIVQGHQYVGPGQPVRVVETAPATAPATAPGERPRDADAGLEGKQQTDGKPQAANGGRRPLAAGAAGQAPRALRAPTAPPPSAPGRRVRDLPIAVRGLSAVCGGGSAVSPPAGPGR